jgi:type IV pilus assembly protein PilA
MKKLHELASRRTGFTMIELMVVIAIVAILAMMTIPSYYYRVVRDQITSISPLTTVAETPIAASWALTQTVPANNEAAGLPSADKMVGNYVTSVQIQNGAVNVTFGNRAIGSINGKILSFRPAVVTDSPIVPITWVCGNAPAPNKMTILGVNQTTIPPALLPLNCK